MPVRYSSNMRKENVKLQNFIRDFPVRCGKILTKYQKDAETSGCEVTFMLSIAAAALPIPFERLRKPVGGIKHPSGDKQKYQRADGKFGNLCDQDFLGSDLWDKKPKSWCIGEVAATIVKNEPEMWIGDVKQVPSSLKVVDVLKHLRNALAHGNIFTLPDDSDEIQEIIFLNRIMCGHEFTGRYSILTVSPIDFNGFLIKWMDFLKALKIE